jgi:hypothetical protein
MTSDANVTVSVLTLSLAAANTPIDANAQIISAANVLFNILIAFLPVVWNLLDTPRA